VAAAAAEAVRSWRNSSELEKEREREIGKVRVKGFNLKQSNLKQNTSGTVAGAVGSLYQWHL